MCDIHVYNNGKGWMIAKPDDGHHRDFAWIDGSQEWSKVAATYYRSREEAEHIIELRGLRNNVQGGTNMGNTTKLPAITMTPEVIDALNEELAYQSTLQGSGRADAREHGVEGQLVTLATYTRKAEDAWTLNAGDEPALNELRKVAATAIRALIQYGCPRRNPAGT